MSIWQKRIAQRIAEIEHKSRRVGKTVTSSKKIPSINKILYDGENVITTMSFVKDNFISSVKTYPLSKVKHNFFMKDKIIYEYKYIGKGTLVIINTYDKR